MRIKFALIPVLALAGLLAACGGGGEGNVTASAPVKAVTAPAGKAWTDVIVKTTDGGYRQGNPDAPIKLVEYGSRNCPYCGLFGRTAPEPLRKNYIATGKVSWEFRDFLIHGAPDLAAALLNQCVPDESFFPVLDKFFENQDTFLTRTEQLVKTQPQLIQQLQQMPPPQAAVAFAEQLGMIDFMKQYGVPEAKARQCLGDQKKIDEIAKVNADGATVYGVNGTPSFFINGKKVEAGSWEQLEPLLKAAGAR
ncbi:MULTISPECIES: DsbA family protein [unclassified Sphingomonas]|uniref:DsbA family protein n=1 Tax=unclassified Sphingomonas TaxID=196159 RepID=UPI0022B34F20|nr:thioredoxin domain-containing protein [Sphingomonas sp. NIBR02145]WHU01859.1 thioredoxin domain-containing protein [Sphingomonas sp. NIBR02145]